MKLRRLGRNRGNALLLTLFFMILMFGLASAYAALVPADLRNALRLKDDTDAFYVADAGITDALAQMEFQVNTDSKTFEDYDSTDNSFWTVSSSVAPLVTPSPTYLPGFTTCVDGRQCVAVKTWSKKITDNMWAEVILERWDCRRSAQYVPSIFHVTSRAVLNRGAGSQAKLRRTVEAWAKQGSFADYGWWNQPYSGSDLVIALNTFKLDGKYHSNGKIILQAPSDWAGSADWSNIPEYSGLGYRASFLAGITMASPVNATINNQQVRIDGIDWSSTAADKKPFDSTGTKIAERYNRITEEQTGAGISSTPKQNLPQGAQMLSRAALGVTYPSTGLKPTDTSFAFASSSNPQSNVQLHIPKGPTTGSYPPAAAGIIVEGDVDAITLSAPATTDGNGIPGDGDTNSVMNITQTRTYQEERTRTVIDTDRRGRPIGSHEETYMADVTETNSVNVTTVYETLTIPAGAKINGSTTPTASPTTLSYSSNGLGYTVVRKGTTNEYQIYEGVANGAVYVDGNINSLQGINRGRKTIATSIDTGDNTAKDAEIKITGDLLRADSPPYRDSNGNTVTPKPTGVRDQLGLVTYAVRLPKRITDVTQAIPQPKNSDGTIPQPTWGAGILTTVNKPLLLYAAIFAGRSDDPKARSSNLTTAQTQGGGMGTIDFDNADLQHFRLMGSLTEGLRQTKGRVGTAGFSYDMMYDNKLRQTSPPFFPGTAGFSLTSWTEYPARQE